MRIPATAGLFLFFTSVFALAAIDITKENKTFKANWEISESINAPESAYYDSDTNQIFVSNVGGNPTEKDGNGFISKVDRSGKNLTAQWISGLNAPKGLRAYKGTLWVTDIDQVIAINIQEGKIIKKIDVAGSKFLNDLAIDKAGIVYVSDTTGSKIFRIEEDKVSVLLEGRHLESPNGLLVDGNRLIVAAWGYTEDFNNKTSGHLYSVGLGTKQIKKITVRPLGNLDGLEFDGKGNFLVSDWVAGKVFKVKANGKSEVILTGFQGAADIGYIARSKTLLVPRMKENKVSAYPLGQLAL